MNLDEAERLIKLHDSGEYLDTEDITDLIEAARSWCSYMHAMAEYAENDYGE